MAVTLRQVGPCFAGEVDGIDMRRKLIDDEQQLAFTRGLGEIEPTLNTGLRAESEYRLPPTFADVSNLDQHNSPFVYAHTLAVGDLVMWDNRQTMHRGRPFPAHEARDVRRTTLAGEGPTVTQQAA